MATQTIGATGRDHTTLAGWITYLDSVSFTEDEIGDVYNDAEVTHTATQSFLAANISNGAFKVILRAAAGQGVADNVNKLTDPLRYNQANGAALKITVSAASGIETNLSNFEMRGLQIWRAGNYGAAVRSTGASTTGLIFSGLLIRHSGAGNVEGLRSAAGVTVENCYAVLDSQNSGNKAFWLSSTPNGSTVRNCMAVGLTSGAGTGFDDSAGNGTYYNCASFGFNTSFDNASAAGSHNASSTTIPFGSSNQASLTTTDQIESYASHATLDLRPKTTGALAGNATAAQHVTPDFFGSTRASAYIGPVDIEPGSAAVARRRAVFIG